MTDPRLDHLGIVVADLDAAKTLFGSALGLPLLREVPAADGKPPIAFFALGDVELEVYERRDLRFPDSSGTEVAGYVEHVAVAVEDLDRTLGDLQVSGVDVDPVRTGRVGRSARTRRQSSSGVVLQVVQAPDPA